MMRTENMIIESRGEKKVSFLGNRAYNIQDDNIFSYFGDTDYAPTISNTIQKNFVLLGESKDISISNVFADKDSDRLTQNLRYIASSDDDSVLVANIIGNDLRLIGVKTGAATVTVTATDLFGNSVSTSVLMAAGDGIWIIDHDQTRKTYLVRANGLLTNSFDNRLDSGVPNSNKGDGITIRRSNEHIYSLQRAGERVNHHDDLHNFIEQFNVFSPTQFAQNDIAYQDSDNTFWFCSDAADKVYHVNSTFTDTISSFSKDAFDVNATNMNGIAFDDIDSTLWISDIAADKIYNVSTTGVLINSFPNSDWAQAPTLNKRVTGISVGDSGDLWLCHTGSEDEVYNITKAGVYKSHFDMTDFESSNLNPLGIYILDKKS